MFRHYKLGCMHAIYLLGFTTTRRVLGSRCHPCAAASRSSSTQRRYLPAVGWLRP